MSPNKWDLRIQSQAAWLISADLMILLGALIILSCLPWNETFSISALLLEPQGAAGQCTY